MFTFKTVYEKANEWNVSVRYVQGLCRQNKIRGVVKRSGIWFIPDSAKCPPKPNGFYLKFRGTKRKIFEKSIKLFAENSYEAVTIKDIADEVGIAQSAIYNHFKSKQEMLDTIYDFFCHYYTADRKPPEELEDILREGSLMDILDCVNYLFCEEYYEIMVHSFKIITQRMFIDKRAREIYKKIVLESGVIYTAEVFNLAVEIGRLAPIDTYALSVFCNSQRMFYYLSWISDADYIQSGQLATSQQALYEMISRSLIDLKR